VTSLKLTSKSYKTSADADATLPEASPDGHPGPAQRKTHRQALGKILYSNSNRKVSAKITTK